MTKSTTKKRLENIESQLTPREWAIWLADEIRKYPSQDDLTRAELKIAHEESVFMKPYYGLDKQAEDRCPGNKPQDARAKNELVRKLRLEFHTLKSIILYVNSDIMWRAETLTLKAGLSWSILHTLILQDIFERTWGETVLRMEAAGKDEKDQHQIMLEKLASNKQLRSTVTRSESLPLRTDVYLPFSSAIQDWMQGVTSLFSDVSSQQAALQLIQDNHFDGHRVLYRDIEKELEETSSMIEQAVSAFNEYQTRRKEPSKAQWESEDQGNGIKSMLSGETQEPVAIDLDSVRNKTNRELTPAVVRQWIKEAKEQATASFLLSTGTHEQYIAYERSRLREIYGDQS
jgi:hypothetical protein